MTNTNKLKGKIAENGFTAEGFAKAMGMTYHKWYNKLRGTTQFSTADVKKAADVLNLTDAEIITIFFAPSESEMRQ